MLCRTCKNFYNCDIWKQSFAEDGEYIYVCDKYRPKTKIDRIKAMSVEEMAEYFALGKHPSSPCYICEHDKGLFCTKEDCNSEYKIKVFKEWLESEVEEDEM